MFLMLICIIILCCFMRNKTMMMMIKAQLLQWLHGRLMSCVALLGGDVQCYYGDGSYAVCGTKRVVLGADASRDERVGGGITPNTRQVGRSER